MLFDRTVFVRIIIRVHCKLIHQQNANVQAEQMFNYVNQNNHLTAANESYDD